MEEEKAELQMAIAQGTRPGLTRPDIQGTLQHHEETGILVATGGEVYIELVSAIIQAAKETLRMAEIQIAPAPPEPETSSDK